jgi:hypothetical protein
MSEEKFLDESEEKFLDESEVQCEEKYLKCSVKKIFLCVWCVCVCV